MKNLSLFALISLCMVSGLSFAAGKTADDKPATPAAATEQGSFEKAKKYATDKFNVVDGYNPLQKTYATASKYTTGTVLAAFTVAFGYGIYKLFSKFFASEETAATKPASDCSNDENVAKTVAGPDLKKQAAILAAANQAKPAKK